MTSQLHSTDDIAVHVQTISADLSGYVFRVVTRLSKKLVETEGEKTYLETQVSSVTHKLHSAQTQVGVTSVDSLEQQVSAIAELKR